MNLLLHPIGQPSFRPALPSLLATPLLPLHHLAIMRSPSYFSDATASFLFESHWLWWIALLVLAGVFYVVGRSRADRRLVFSGTLLLVPTAAWILLALLVASPGERLFNAHKHLADAAARHDVDQMLTCISPTFIAPVVGITPDISAKERIAEALNTNGIKDTYITSFKYTRGTTTAVSDVTLITESNAGAIKTAWRLSWDDVPGEDWKIVRADLLRLADQPVPKDFTIP